MSKSKSSISFSSSAAAVLENIDLLTQILLRVPPSPLLEFKLVSRKWHSIISDPQFCFSHARFHHENPNSSCLFLSHDGSPTSQVQFTLHDTVPSTEIFSVPIPDCLVDGSCLHIEHECNGLLLLFSQLDNKADTQALIDDNRYVLAGDVDDDMSGMYFVCNPITKQCRILKFPHELRFCFLTCVLAFDPSISPYYKIITLANPGHRFDLYSSETDSWSLLGIPVDRQIFRYSPGFPASPVYYNGAMHWPSTYFDLETQLLSRKPELPMLEFAFPMYFGVCRGYFHLIFCDSPWDLEFNVFEMGNDFSKWSLKYHVNFDTIIFGLPDGPGLNWEQAYSIDSVVCSGKMKQDIILVLRLDDVIMAYDFCSGALRKLCQVHQPSTGKLMAFPFVKSLFMFMN